MRVRSQPYWRFSALTRPSLPVLHFQGSAERRSVFGGPAGRAGSALAGDDYVPNPEVVQGVLDAGLAVAAVGGHDPRPAPGAADDPLNCGGQSWRVGRVAGPDGVVEHDAVVVVDDLRLVAELHRLAEAALGDRAGIGVVQADQPPRPVRSDPGQALPRPE
jgi:hypothetical protein